MPCSICRQSGHNRATCPQNPELRSGRRRRVRPHRRTITPPPLPSRPQSSMVVPSDNSPPRFRWFSSFNKIIRLCKFINIVDQFTLREIELGENDIREVYVSWLKVKTNSSDRIHLDEKCLRLMKRDIHGSIALDWLQNIRDKINKCIIFHNEINDSLNNSTDGDTRKRIDFMNLRTENYLVYWVVGNYLVEDLDEGVNNIRYLGIVRPGLKFNVKTLDGHRFYLVPHRLDIEPPYHPQTDKEFFIEPYCEINIHEGTQKIIFIDNKESLSELNRWKFNALKLDYLVREIIKLGGKDNDMFGLILDLHDDIQLEEVSDTIKDIAGIPSKMTNIT